MNHQPFETWIFTDDQILPENQKELEKHLQKCEDCANLAHAIDRIHKTFSNASEPEPERGFTQRFYNRLTIFRQQRQQRRMWFLTLGIFSLALVLILTIIFLNLGQINWFYEFSQIIANSSRFTAQINQAWFVLRSLTKAIPMIIPVLIIFSVGLLSATTALVVTWFSSMIKLYQPFR